MAPETSQTLDRGVRLMLAVAEAPAGFTVAELAESLALNRTVVHRLVTTLAGHDLVTRDAHGRVVAGAALLRLGQTLRPVLLARTTPVLRALADRVGATAHLTVAEGEEAVAVVVVEPGWTDLHVAYRVGARHRLADAASGRAIALGRETGDARGWAVSRGEVQPGTFGLAAPVPSTELGEAAVGLVTLDELDEDAVGPLVVAAALEVAEVLGA
ncbi:helix-turn-helix domain-containing protein [Solicola sp. PLA-1-18]|uniref:helix-turn-helix domain-containing protein n=1 Tax=Solicola sp. PLA-1-18 TaxID=3380532 RepID=UPI003B78B1FF